MIENRDRELWSRLLIAAALHEAGVSSVVGSQRLMGPNLEDLPQGCVVFKGMNKAQRAGVERAKRSGHVTAAIDEEGLNICDPAHYRRDIAANIGIHISFVSQKWQEDHAPGGMLTGNPRLDLLHRPEVFGEPALWRKKGEERGDYVLINTNSGGGNPKIGSIREYHGMCESIGYFEDREDFLDHIRHDWANIRNIRAFIEAYIESCDGYILLRPHPSENPDPWFDLYRGHPRVSVTPDGSHVQMIKGAKCLVHTGCTTAIEAAHVGVPSVSILAGDYDDEVFASNHEPFSSTGDIFKAVSMVMDAPPVGSRISGEDRKVFLQEFGSDGIAHRRIAERLAPLSGQKEAVTLKHTEAHGEEYFKAKGRFDGSDIKAFCGKWGLDLPHRQIGESVYQLGDL